MKKKSLAVVSAMLFGAMLNLNAQQLPLVSELKVETEIVRADTTWTSKSTSPLAKKNATQNLRNQLLKANAADTLVQENVSYTYKSEGNMMVCSLSVSGYPARRVFHTATPEEYAMLFPQPATPQGEAVPAATGSNIKYSGMFNFVGGMGMRLGVAKTDKRGNTTGYRTNLGGSYGFYTTHGLLFNDMLFLGCGFGLNGITEDDTFLSVPIYAALRTYFNPVNTSKTAGWWEMKAGSHASFSSLGGTDITTAGGLFLQTGFGFKVKKFDMGLNYEVKSCNIASGNQLFGALQLSIGFAW